MRLSRFTFPGLKYSTSRHKLKQPLKVYVVEVCELNGYCYHLMPFEYRLSNVMLHLSRQ